jgi:hypothetical protein
MQYIFKPSREEKYVPGNSSTVSPASLGINLGDILTAALPQMEDMSPIAVDHVVRCFEHVDFDQYENVLVEEDLGVEAFVLLTGQLQIAINGKIIRVISKPGSLLGERSLFTDAHKVGATVTAAGGGASLMRLRRAAYRDAVSRGIQAQDSARAQLSDG